MEPCKAVRFRLSSEICCPNPTVAVAGIMKIGGIPISHRVGWICFRQNGDWTRPEEQYSLPSIAVVRIGFTV